MPDERETKLRLEIGHVLFIDIVGYSKLLINQQSEQLETLKAVVRGTDQFKKAEADINAFTSRLLSVKGKRTPTSLHRELGKLLWEKCGMARNEAGLKGALQRIPELREQFWKTVNVTGENGELNQGLEYAGRVADFMEFAELLCQFARDGKVAGLEPLGDVGGDMLGAKLSDGVAHRDLVARQGRVEAERVVSVESGRCLCAHF